MSAAAPPPSGQLPDSPQNFAAAIADVSDRATVLVREEIELAKAEVSEKVGKLARGAVVGIAAGVFVLGAVIFALIGFAWLLYYFLPGSAYTYFWGFFAMAVILLVLGALAGVVAARVVKRGAPPVPNMAIEEARKIRDTVSSGSDAPSGPAAGVAGAGMPAAAVPGPDDWRAPTPPGVEAPS